MKLAKVGVVVLSLLTLVAGIAGAGPLDPRTLTKFVDPLPLPNVLQPTKPNGTSFVVTMSQFAQQLHSQLPPTTVWGYNGTFPGPTFEAKRGVPISVTYKNNLPTTHLLSSAIDHTFLTPPTLPDVRNVVHLHGAEVRSDSDGNPMDWMVPGQSTTYSYPNSQRATTLWYHDHTAGITRLNVFAGLAGFYLLRDPAVDTAFNLPSGEFEVPLVIQDRAFNTDGSLNYLNDVPPNPTVHPQWIPEFFGDAVLVNGKIWPFLNVEPRKYRFRVLDGSDARMYNLSFSGPQGMVVPPIFQIGTDGGYLPAPAAINELFIAPGERADLVIDFRDLPVGTALTLTNSAKAPFPHGAPPDPQTVAQIMQFRVVPLTGPDTSSLPSTLVGPLPALSTTATRRLTLNEIEGPGGPLTVLLNNSHFDSGTTETPRQGATETWEIINTTADTHPIHLHLIQFQLVSRQKYAVGQYLKTYDAAFPGEAFIPEFGPPLPYGQCGPGKVCGGNPDATPFLQGGPSTPPPNDTGWKDTIKMHPGEITKIIVRWAPQDAPTSGRGAPGPGSNFYPFDPTVGPGYVWHCHILEHEDNDMMRPYKVTR